jgi:hypothetical protein
MPNPKGKKIIGTRVCVTIGHQVDRSDDDVEILGQDIDLQVSPEDLEPGTSVTGLETRVEIGPDPNDLLRQIAEVLESSSDPRRNQIITLARSAMADSNHTSKWTKIREIIALGANVSEIAGIIVTLTQLAS